MTNNKEKGRLRLSLRRGGILGRTDTITISREEIMQDNQGLPMPRRLIQCSESRFGKLWRRLKTNHSSSGRINDWKPYEAQSKPLLPLPSGTGTYYKGLQEPVGSFGSACPRKQTKITLASFQWPGEPDKFKLQEESSFQASFMNNQRHLCRSWKDWILSLQSDVSSSIVNQ